MTVLLIGQAYCDGSKVYVHFCTQIQVYTTHTHHTHTHHHHHMLTHIITLSTPLVTTIRPHLGVLSYGGCELTLADLPGLVEGAHLNVGMGHKFLKHVERTKALLFVVGEQCLHVPVPACFIEASVYMCSQCMGVICVSGCPSMDPYPDRYLLQ